MRTQNTKENPFKGLELPCLAPSLVQVLRFLACPCCGLGAKLNKGPSLQKSQELWPTFLDLCTFNGSNFKNEVLSSRRLEILRTPAKYMFYKQFSRLRRKILRYNPD